MIINLDIPFDFYQVVYIIHDVEQRPFMVIGAKVCADGGLLIELQSGGVISFHYVGEISVTKNVLLSTTN